MTSSSKSSIQETSDEGSVQFDSSSEEAKIRYVMRVFPNKWYRDEAVTIEVTIQLWCKQADHQLSITVADRSL